MARPRREAVRIVVAGAAGAVLIIAGSAAFFFGDRVGASAGAQDTSDGQAGPPPAAVAVAKAEQRQLAPQSETPGSVVSTRDSLVSAATSGKLEWVAEVGAEVEEGEVIARIDVSDAELTRDNSMAEVARLRARAEGSVDAAMAVLGMMVGGGLVHQWGIVSTSAGPTPYGKAAVLLGLAFCFGIVRVYRKA